ncbi:phosphoglycerol transferase [Bifidobacterium apri]|uniref:Phosphoglycerol transferase n=1 Tax=Bifidobacterium apri TaxID=1769423 RepID=A0A6A2VXD9_9BIFI|nr:phosphoglycerol transferase [Bifidobacterium apri]
MPCRYDIPVEQQHGQGQDAVNLPDSEINNVSPFAHLLDTDGIGYDTFIPGDDGLIHTHHTSEQYRGARAESTAERLTNSNEEESTAERPADHNAEESSSGQPAIDAQQPSATHLDSTDEANKPGDKYTADKTDTAESAENADSANIHLGAGHPSRKSRRRGAKMPHTAPEQPATTTAPAMGTVFKPDGSVDVTNASVHAQTSPNNAEPTDAQADAPQSGGNATDEVTESITAAASLDDSEHPAQQPWKGFAARLGTAWATFHDGVSTAWSAVASFFSTVFGAIARGWHAFASAIARGWHAFTSLKAVHAVISALKFFKSRIWDKRMRFSFAFYTIVFIVVTAASVLGLQWSVYSEPTYAKGQVVDDQTKALNSVAGQLTSFVSQIWLHHSYQAWLNFIVLGVLYLTFILVINRFWVATALFGTLMTVFAIANKIKVELRNEPIIPADLQFVTGGNGGSIMSFTTKKDMVLINSAVTGVIWLIVVCVVLQFLDRRRGLIPYTWKPSKFVSVKNITAMVCRWAAAVLSIVLCVSFTWGLSVTGSWAKNFATGLSDAPQLWSAMGDATANGPAMNFLRLAHVKIMDKPNGYSKEKMESLAKKYAGEAEAINQTRTANLTDNTVIMILSESFSDPTRVPGVSFTEDPMPQIRAIKSATTSGLMLSPGYGGGTANIEYQALTGLNMANYDSTLSIAYQQLVPKLKWTPTFNQIWNEANGKSSSIAFHAYYRTLYLRDSNYKKFGFSKFYAIDGKPVLNGLSHIDNNWAYYSDASFYTSTVNTLFDSSASSTNQFIQMVTMQNHLPYLDWYSDNPFKGNGGTSTNMTEDERTSIETYARGVNYTDQATVDFLNQLNQIDRPITVIFYGDHLPGIYSTASEDKANQIALHETDYFIWSNAASASATTKLDDSTSAYTSSNYFMAQAAEHLNAKVSPYLAFLTEMHAAIPAISVPASAGDSSQPVYLDAEGNRIRTKNLTADQKDLLHDYQLIQYDLTAGKQYLKNTDFMTVAQ